MPQTPASLSVNPSQAGTRTALRLLLAMSTVYFLLEFLPNLVDGYGYFIDELYYIACSNRLALGYVDHPPFSIAVLAAWQAIAGTSIAALRFLPALCGGLTVLMTGLLARRMGAGLFGQGLAAGAYMAAAVPMVMFGIYSMNAIQMLLWSVLLYFLVVLASGGSDRLWVWFGVLAGVGLMNKHTLVLLAPALAVGLLLTPARRHLAKPHLWLGVALAALILAPNLVWQIQNGWPSLEFYRNAALQKNLPAGPGAILMAQILFMNPVGALVWIPGLMWLLFSRRAQSFRFLGWMFLTLLLILMLSGQSRPDRITGIYPIVFAAGGLFWEAVTAQRRKWLGWGLATVLLASGLFLVPLGVPLLSPEQTERYAAWTGMVPQMERGEGKTAELPQWFADRFGWEVLARDVAEVYASLPPEQRATTVILAPSYGHAGALELFGPAYNLPPVCSPQNSYHLWGLPDRPIETVISLGFGPDSLGGVFSSIEKVATYRCTHCMRWRDHMSIFIARGPQQDLHEAWKSFKNYQ